MANKSQSEPTHLSRAKSPLAIHLQIDEPAIGNERPECDNDDATGDFTVAYETSAFSTPSTIADQMRELGERLPGAMSWLSLFEQD